MLFVIHGAFFRKMMYDAPIPPTCSTCCYYCIPILTFPFISPLVFSLLCFMPHYCKPLALMDVLWNPSCSCFLFKPWYLILFSFPSFSYHIHSLCLTIYAPTQKYHARMLLMPIHARNIWLLHPPPYGNVSCIHTLWQPLRTVPYISS